jgi:hypothetical protein
MRIRTALSAVLTLLLPNAGVEGQRAEAVAFVLLEPDSSAAAQPSSDLPLLREISRADPRWVQAQRLADNEAARFALQLVAAAWRVTGRQGELPALPILLVRGGNNAALGYRTRDGTEIVIRAGVPYIALDLQPARFRLTLLHEAGHVAHEIVRDAKRARPPWTAIPHSTFAVTDPLTALSEGYAIQLETLWAHFGADSAQRAFYTRARPDFNVSGSAAPFYFPANDLLNFSQTWARYAAVRDGDAAFAGHIYPDYLRSQYDPARDRATLKRPNAMIASEGVVASALFWTVAEWAMDAGAKPALGLDQAEIMRASVGLLRALRDAGGDSSAFRPDVIDVVAAAENASPNEHRTAVARFIDITRGATARPALRDVWRSFYQAASVIDLQSTAAALKISEAARAELLKEADADPRILRRGIGPVLAVRVAGRMLELKALGERFPLEIDLNAAGDAELAAMTRLNSVMRRRIATELDRQPFLSLREFERRAGISLAMAGLTPVESVGRGTAR